MSKESQSSRASYYNADLDVLRLCACTAVFFHHALPQSGDFYRRKLGIGEGVARFIEALVVAGGLGVDLFFVLSSFLITKLLLLEHSTTGAFHVGNFLIRRALRIWPLYFVFLALVIFVVPSLLPNDSLGRQLPWFLCFLGNWSTGWFGYPRSVAAPLWSVSIEEQFYIFWPLLLLLLGIPRILPIAVGMVLVSGASRLVLVTVDAAHPAIWTNTFARLDPIAVGIVVAVLSQRRGAHLSYVWSLTTFAAGAGCVVLAVFSLGSQSVAGPRSLLLYPVVAFGAGLMVYGIVFSKSRVLDVRVSRIDRLLIRGGRISYGLYVFHVLGIQLTKHWLPPIGDIFGLSKQVTFVSAVPVSGLLTVLMAVISFKILEEPFLRLKRRFTYVRSAPIIS